MNLHIFYISCWTITILQGFSLIDDEMISSKMYHDYMFTVKYHLQWTEKNVILRIYISSFSNMYTGLIIQNFCSIHDKRSIIISTSDGDFMERSISEKIGMAIANTDYDLQTVLNLLYYRSQHDYSVVCLTYPITDVTTNLSALTSKIWKRGLSRNIFFLVISLDRRAVVVLRSPSYELGVCSKGNLIEVGYVKNKKFVSINNNFLPQYDNLGGCELNIMVQPPYVPYVKTRTSEPGGMIGMLVDELSKKMNFSPKYHWSFGRELAVKHYKTDNLNILFDLLPRTIVPVDKYSFNCGLVKTAFLVPRSKKILNSTNLLNPFHYSVWICLAVTLLCLTVAIHIITHANIVNTFLKVYGVLLGVSGQITRANNVKLIFWVWLLPAFILQQSYIADLIRNMAIAEPEGEIDTIPQLIDSDMKIVCTSEMRTHFCKSISLERLEFVYLCLLCKEVEDEYIFKKLYPLAMKGKIFNKTSFIANEEVISFTVGRRRIRFVRGSFVWMPQMVTVRPGNPYIFEIYKIYHRCVEAGLFEYWKNSIRPVYKRRKKLTFVDIINDKLQRCFIIVYVGLMIAILTFAGEILIYYKFNK